MSAAAGTTSQIGAIRPRVSREPPAAIAPRSAPMLIVFAPTMERMQKPTSQVGNLRRRLTPSPTPVCKAIRAQSSCIASMRGKVNSAVQRTPKPNWAPRLRVGADAAGVVVTRPGDEAWPQDLQETLGAEAPRRANAGLGGGRTPGCRHITTLMRRFEELAFRRLDVRAELHALKSRVFDLVLGSQRAPFSGSTPRQRNRGWSKSTTQAAGDPRRAT